VNSFELERFVGLQLRALPLPRAPHTLLPRVMASARAWAQRPWYAREWFTWPLGWQLGSLVLLMLMIGGGIVAMPLMQLGAGHVLTSVTSSVEVDFPRFIGGFQVSTTALRVIWRALVQPFLPYAFAIVALMCGACATVVFALNRVVFGRALPS
jgi:hypothetical protein